MRQIQTIAVKILTHGKRIKHSNCKQNLNLFKNDYNF